MTNNIRPYLWIALAVVLFLNYQAWMRDYGPQQTAGASAPGTTGAQPAAPTADLANQIPQASKSQPAAAGPGSSAAPASPAALAPPAEQAAQPAGGETVHVRTDVLDVEISTRGGTIQRVDLLKYPKVKGEAAPVRLENTDDPVTQYVLQTGLTGTGDTPTHLAQFSAPEKQFDIDAHDELRVPLTWTDGKGTTVTKTYVFRRGEYGITIEYGIHNQSDMPFQVAQYAQILRNDPRTKSSMFNFNAERYAFHGPAIFDGNKYRKLDFTSTDDSHLAIDVQNGWIAALQHHFVTAVVPPKGETHRVTLSAAGDQYRLAAAGPTHTVEPGSSLTLQQTVYIGPKLQGQLESAGPRLELVADYGKLTFLAKPLFWLLDKVQAVTGNWGVAIILVTFLLKLLFYPLSEASGRSMAKMKALAPRIKNLQETYKDDREKQSRAMMELYQREKVNPVAGCLPMIIQIPVFLAFYWVLLESVEMRQAPFAGWIHDLSARDPWFILPGIMAAAMFAQYKLNPAPPDPVQARVFMIMPLVMSVTFAFFPAGLVLYWVTNTVLSIAQQWNINRRIAAAGTRKN
jgi:YidC/Oxa1 family membrane protein insertase